MSQESPDVVTTQPNWKNDTINDVIKENENPVAPEDAEKAEERKRRRNDCNDGVCCYVPDDDDIFLNILMCRWLGNCFASCCQGQEGCCTTGNEDIGGGGDGDCCDCGDCDCDCGDCDCGDCDCGDCDCGDCSCFN